jgi:hypothetical protein
LTSVRPVPASAIWHVLVRVRPWRRRCAARVRPAPSPRLAPLARGAWHARIRVIATPSVRRTHHHDTNSANLPDLAQTRVDARLVLRDWNCCVAAHPSGRPTRSSPCD